MISKKKVKEIIDFYDSNNLQKTLETFNLTDESFHRYERLFDKYYGKDKRLKNDSLRKIAEQYTDKELKAIARGGRIIQGMAKTPIVTFEGEKIVFGILGDTHLGSIYTDTSYIDLAFQEFKKEKCDFVVHVGDVCEGMSNRAGHVYELSHIGYEHQKEHAVDVLSRWVGKMYFISGNHDRWYIKSNGANIVKDIANELPNADFLGHDLGNISVNGSIIELWHGEDGSSYAISYRIQKIVESMTGGTKPNILICGHVHKMGYFFIRHIHCIGAGSLQKQTAWMRGKRLDAHTGFWIVEAWINKGVSKIKTCWYPFYA